MLIINSKLLRSRFKVNSLVIVSFTLLSLVSSILLLNSKIVYPGMDTQFHFRRIMELNSLISHGHLLSNFSFNEFHGSSVLTLYPYLNLLPSVFLSFIIKSKIDLYYSIFMFNTFLTFVISFYSCKSYVQNYSVPYMFSIIYGLSNIFLGYYTIEGDFGVIYSYIFLPIIIFSFLKMIKGDNTWIALSLGMSLILYSHILNLIIIGIFLMIMFIINVNKLNKTIIIRLIKSIILFIMITAIIWLPFLSFYFKNINNIHLPPMNQLSIISIKDFISGIYGSKSFNTIGFFPIISMFVSLFFYKKFNHYIKQMYLLSLITVFSVLFFPWKFITSYGTFQILNQFQFTYRFLIIPQLVLIFTFSLMISKYILNYRIRTALYFLIILIVVFLQLVPGQYSIIKTLYNAPASNYKINNSNKFDVSLDNFSIADDDYIPKSALAMSSYVNKSLGSYNNHHIKVNHIEYNTFNFSTKNNINKLSLPIYAYNKEKLNIYLNDEPVKYYANKDGLLTIYNINSQIKTNNKIYIQEKTSRLKITGIVLSILGWLFALYVLVKRKFKY